MAKMKEGYFGAAAPPKALLLLGALCPLGRDQAFSDIEESTAVGAEARRQLHHAHVNFGNVFCTSNMPSC